MSGGTISGNTSSSTGGGVYVDEERFDWGTFIMSGGTISGNTSSISGGGVYVKVRGKFTKTGGTISGNDTVEADKNKTEGNGDAVYRDGGNWRNATAGPRMNTDTYGFWMND